MKSNGYTLIEVLAGIFILMLGIMGCSIIISSSREILLKKENRLKTFNYAMAISEYYMGCDEEKIIELCRGSECSYYVYFNDINELYNELIGNINLVESVEDSYTGCLSLNNNKLYGGFIFAKLINTNNTSKVKLYELGTKIWNFKYGETSEEGLTIIKGAVEK